MSEDQKLPHQMTANILDFTDPQAEYERVRSLVEEAYDEGLSVGLSASQTFGPSDNWESSAAKKQLENPDAE